MKNECQKVTILSSNSEMVTIHFLDMDVIMPISISLLKEKIKDNFYKLVEPVAV